jgi:hypothetical protein
MLLRTSLARSPYFVVLVLYLTSFPGHQWLPKRQVSNDFPKHRLQLISKVYLVALGSHLIEIGNRPFDVQFLDRLLACECLRCESPLNYFVQLFVECWIWDRDERRRIQYEIREKCQERSSLGETTVLLLCIYSRFCLESRKRHFVWCDSYGRAWSAIS